MTDILEKINPFSTENPMSLKDAAVLATVTAFVIWVLTFFANASYVVITANTEEFMFEACKTYAIAWAGNFVTLAGLEQLIKRSQET